MIFVFNSNLIDFQVFDLNYIFNNKRHFKESTEETSTKRLSIEFEDIPPSSDELTVLSDELLQQYSQANSAKDLIYSRAQDELSRWFGRFYDMENNIVIRKISIMARLPSCEPQVYHMDGYSKNHYFAIWPLGLGENEGKFFLT